MNQDDAKCDSISDSALFVGALLSSIVYANRMSGCTVMLVVVVVVVSGAAGS